MTNPSPAAPSPSATARAHSVMPWHAWLAEAVWTMLVAAALATAQGDDFSAIAAGELAGVTLLWLIGAVVLAGGFRYALRRNREWSRALHAAEERSRLLYAQAPVACHSLDADGRVLSVNDAWLTLFGYAREETVSQPIGALLGPQSVPTGPARFSRVAAVARSAGGEAVYRRKDGSAVVVDVVAQIEHDAEGKVERIHCALHDVTARQQAESALRASNVRLGALIANLQVGVLVEDAQRRVVVANAAFVELFGFGATPAALEAGDGVELLRRSASLVADADRYIARVETLFAAGESSRGELIELADGRAFERDYVPIADAGPGGGHLWVYRDITERRRMQQALEKRLVALTRPTDGAEGIEFEDLFDPDEIQKLQDQFARATGVASLITHPDGRPLTRPSGFTRLCAGIIRGTEKGRCNCLRSDAVLGRGNPDGPILQPCLSGGLWDAGASIVVGGRHIANWLIGQVRNEDQDEARMRDYAREIGAEEEAFMSAFREVPCMSRERFEDIAQTLFTLTRQLSSMAYQNVQQARFITERDRAEQALRAGEAQFRETIEHAGVGYVRIDCRGQIEAVNPAWLQMHGYTDATQVHGRHYAMAMHPEDVIPAAAVVRRAAAGEEIRSGEFRHRKADGSIGHHSFSLHPVRKGDDVVAIECFLINTTALKRAEADYRMLFETMLDGFALHEIVRNDAGEVADLRYIALNPAFERHTGLTPATTVGRLVSEVAPPLEPSWMERYRRVAETGEPLVFESYSQGLQRYFKVSAFRPAPGQLVCVFVDITARKLAEIELRKLSRAVEQSPISVVITDLDGVIEYVNPSFTRVTGYALDELRGKTSRLLSSGEMPAAFYRHLWETIRAGGEWRGEFLNRKKDGSLFWEAATIGPIFDEAGAITRYLGLKEDITERKRAEARMREQAALLDVTHDAIMVVGMDRIVTYWNRGAEQMYGVPAASACGRKFEEIVYQQPPADFLGKWQAMVAAGTWTGDRLHRTATGREIATRVRGQMMHGPDGEPQAALLVVTDVTESKQMEKQFLRAQRLESLGALASGVAHDLNNVLTPILMSIELLGPLAREQQDQDMLRLLSDSARRGSDIVQQLLLFGRGSDSPRAPLNAGSILKDMGRMMRETFPKTITVSVSAPADLRLIEADRTQIHQVVLNLCVNARDAMPKGGRLTLTAENAHVDEVFARAQSGKRTGPHVRITVRDTGTGITPENLEKIFDPFFTTKPVGEGTGLGLATVIGIVRGHEGLVTVRTELGRGSSFEVWLPAVSADAVLPVEQPAIAGPTGRGELVLVIEDEEPIRSMLQRALTRHNYEVLTASDGAEGLGVFAHHAGRIALVVTDSMMPVMSGAETVRALRQRNPQLPVVAISGLPGQEAELAQNPGPRVRFLSKPFATEHALRLIRETLDEATPKSAPA